MKMHQGILAALALLSFAGAAVAVETSTPYRASGNTHRIAVTSTASAAERLTAFSSDVTCTQIKLSNLGTMDVYVALGATAESVATVGIPAAGVPASGILVRAGNSGVVGGPSQPYISAKTASSTSTLDATCGQGEVSDLSTNVTTSPAPTSSSISGIAPVTSSSAESSKVLKNAAGNLYGVCTTNGATAGYIMLFNATSAPADGAVTPVAWVAAPGTSTTYCYNPGAVPDYYSTGITVVYSSTGPFTKTASATAAFVGKVQ